MDIPRTIAIDDAINTIRRRQNVMYFFNNYKDGLSHQGLPSLGGTSVPVGGRKRSLFEVLTDEEKPYSIGSLALILVLLLHAWAGLWLLRPVERIMPAQPMLMEVSLVSAPSRQASAALPAPLKPVEPVKPIKPKQAPPKKPLKQKKPLRRKQEQFSPKASASDIMPPAPSVTEAPAEAPDAKAANIAPSPAASTKPAQKTEEPFSVASFNANYGSNPKPKYPSMARSRGWQGEVLLRVSVSAEGFSDEVAVHRGSGHEVLDESAVEAVEKWRFIPARRGDTPVASSVIVPIIFTLNH